MSLKASLKAKIKIIIFFSCDITFLPFGELRDGTQNQSQRLVTVFPGGNTIT